MSHKAFNKQIAKTSPFAKRAFTLVELLAVLAAITLLSCLLVPAFAKARQSPLATQCLSNERQLMLAALMYAEDSSGLWFPNQPSSFVGQEWVSGFIGFAGGTPGNYDISTLTNPRNDYLAKYISSPRIFRCPSDQSRVPEGPRIRSVSASQAVGTIFNAATLSCGYKSGDPVTGQWLTGANTDCSSTWRRYGKASDMVAPGPSQLWVFADEHPDSINDSSLALQVANTNIGGQWIDIPASYHNGAVSLSFADGHAELHQWVGTAVSGWPINWTAGNGVAGPAVATAADVQDLRWLQQRTSALAN